VEKKTEQQVRVEMSTVEDGTFKAVVTTTSEVNGEVQNEDIKEFTGSTEEEVKAKVEAYTKAVNMD